MSNTITTLLLLSMTATLVLSGEYTVEIKTPKILKEHFNEGLPFITIMPGKQKQEFESTINIKTLASNKSGCRKYKEDFHGKETGVETAILLVDSDNCSLSTKIHYAQLSGVSALFLKYIDDNIEEAEIDHSSFEGVRIPIFMIKNSDADYIYDVLNSTDGVNDLQINLKHVNQIDQSDMRIQIYMSSQPINNPMIRFLRDLTQHSKLISKFSIDIHFSLGFCRSCKEKKFMRSEPSCLSGGRYCVINSEFKSNELVKETLRQICIRDNNGSDKLIKYLVNLKTETEILYYTQKFKEKDLPAISKKIMEGAGIEYESVRRCTVDSYKLHADQTEPDVDLDDNTKLFEEQSKFLKITKFNIFPLIIINNVYYDRTINIREFIRFGCQNKMFDCRGFKTFKRFFIIILASVSLFFILGVIIFCRRVMKKKMDDKLDLKVNEAVQKYLTVDKA